MLGPGLERGALSSGGADACGATPRGTDCWREIGGGIAAATTGFVGGCIGAAYAPACPPLLLDGTDCDGIDGDGNALASQRASSEIL
jgi:hypothetical protein